MLIYEALKKDHDTLKPLLDQLVNASSLDDESRTSLINQIRDEIVPHARAEEAVFYNSLASIDASKGIVTHSYGEHMAAETMLRTLQGLDKVGLEFETLAKQFRDSVLHHIQEEETRVFAEARQVLLDEEARLMADAFEKMKPEVREQGFMKNTLNMIANMMPQRFASPLRSFTSKN